jgi:hypothetical protein
MAPWHRRTLEKTGVSWSALIYEAFEILMEDSQVAAWQFQAL